MPLWGFYIIKLYKESWICFKLQNVIKRDMAMSVKHKKIRNFGWKLKIDSRRSELIDKT